MGGAAGNIICVHNVVAASAVVGLLGKEGIIIRKTLPAFIYYALMSGSIGYAIVWSSTKGLLFFLEIKIVIGTPQFLCLDIHQSGLSFIIDRILFLLTFGIQFTFSISLIAVFLNPSFSMDINHCEVALNIKGALDLHEWG